MDLIEFADLKSLLGLDCTSIDEYPALALLRNSVSAAIESHLGRALEYGNRTEQVELWEHDSMVPLRALPVESVDTVTVTLFGGSTASTVTGWMPTNYGIALLSPAQCVVSVTYNGGLTEVPDWLRRAALMQTAYEFQNKDHIGADFVTIEGGSVKRSELSLLKEVRRLLDAHRHPARLFW